MLSATSLFKLCSTGLGAFLGIYLIARFQLLEALGAGGLYLVGSFGATAVLIYGEPAATFSQPRNVVGGHVLSALVGVASYLALKDDLALASAAAVSIATVLMSVTKTLHPPGGATALIAVIGGEPVHALGFSYVTSPILVGVLFMMGVAVMPARLSRAFERHQNARRQQIRQRRNAWL